MLKTTRTIGPGPSISKWQNQDIVGWQNWTSETFRQAVEAGSVECPILIRFWEKNVFRFAAIVEEVIPNSKIELKIKKLDDGSEEIVLFNANISIEEAILNKGAEK